MKLALLTTVSIALIINFPANAQDQSIIAKPLKGTVRFTSPDKRHGIIEGRTRVPLSKKLNPIWWFGNDEDPRPPKDYMVGSPWRDFMWLYVRNPFHNGAMYVVGFSDMNYRVWGYPQAFVHFRDKTRDDSGWVVQIINPYPLVYLPYVTHTDRLFKKGLGWQSTGRLAGKFQPR